MFTSPFSGLVKSLNRPSSDLLQEEKLSVIFDAEMKRSLVSLLDYFQTTAVAPTDISISSPRLKSAVLRFAQSTFLSRESVEKRVLAPFLTLHADALEWNEEDFLNCLHDFYNKERISIISLVNWLLKFASSNANPEVLAMCRVTLKTLLDGGICEKAANQLHNLSSISLPTTLLQAGQPNVAYSWIHQNILEQLELAKLMFNLVSADFMKFDTEELSRVLCQLVKGNFGLAGSNRFNLDADSAQAAQEAFYYRQAAAIRILGLKSMLSSSVSPQVIISTLNPLKTSHVLKTKETFKNDLSDNQTAPFKLAWALLVGHMDLLEILDNSDLRYEFPKVAAQSIDAGAFRSMIECIANTGSTFKDLFKDVLISFFSVFDLDQATTHVPIITEFMIAIFTGESKLCDEFWFVDSQYSGRAAIITYWVNRFPFDYIQFVRLMWSLSCSPASAQIVFEFLLKGFDRIFVERAFDRGQVLEEYDLATEVYNLTVSSRTEVKAGGISFLLESETHGVMKSGFNERPMVHWNVPVSFFHFILRILQSDGADERAVYFILDLFEGLLQMAPDFAQKLVDHLEATAPAFASAKVDGLPRTCLMLLLKAVRKGHSLILSKCLQVISALEPVLPESEPFMSMLRQESLQIMDGMASILRKSVVEIDADNFSLLSAILKFTECIISCVDEEDTLIIRSLRQTVFAYIVEQVGKWRFACQKHRLALLSEVCRLVLLLDKTVVDGETTLCVSQNFALLSSICLLIDDLTDGAMRELLEYGVDFSIFFMCLSAAIESCTSAQDRLSLAEFFSQPHLLVATEGLRSPLAIIASAMKRSFFTLPVLLFFQYVFQSEAFALNIRMIPESLDLIGDSCKAILSATPSNSLHMKLRSAAWAVLNNAACTRPDIFLYLYCRAEECLLDLLSGCVKKEEEFSHELLLICGLISVIWNAVADFTPLINALKKKSASLIVDLASLMTREWPESKTPIALKTISAVCEVLAVELCYFNCSTKIPSSALASTLSQFDPNRFIQRISLFAAEFKDDFETFCESYVLFANSLVSLPGERDACTKILKSLILLATGDGPSQLDEIYRIIGYGLLLHRPTTEAPVLLGHEAFERLLDHLLDCKFADAEKESAELLTVLLSSNPKLSVTQQGKLLQAGQTVLDRLRRVALTPPKDSLSVSPFVGLLIGLVRLGLKEASGEMIHFVRREAALKTAFTLIRCFRDCESLALFTAAAVEVEALLEEFVSGDLMELFIESGTLSGEDAFVSQYLTLLAAVKVHFMTSSVMAERVSTVLYATNVKAMLESEKNEALLGILQLLACSLENPIEVPATEAFLASLVEGLLKLLVRLVTREEFDSAERVLRTLFAFSLYGRGKFAVKRNLQALLYPPLESSSSEPSSANVSALLALRAMLPDLKGQAEQVLTSNCPERNQEFLLSLLK